MSKTATLEIEGKKYELPIFIGTENEMSIDISKLRDLSGAITLDQGYKNTGACKSEITFLDGEEGILHYRGYSRSMLFVDFWRIAYSSTITGF
jgi:citrate synthase